MTAIRKKWDTEIVHWFHMFIKKTYRIYGPFEKKQNNVQEIININKIINEILYKL